MSAVQGECAAQKRLSEAESEMDRKLGTADIALYETNRELESQRLELYQVNPWEIRLKEKRLICAEIGIEKRTLPRKSRKRSPRNWEITKNLLRRSRSSQTLEN